MGEDLRARRARLTPELIALLSEELAARLTAWEGALAEEPTTAAEAERVEADLGELEAVLDAIAAQIPEIEERLDALPRSLPDVLKEGRIPNLGAWGKRISGGPWRQPAAPRAPCWEEPQAWVRHYVHQHTPEAEGTLDIYLVASDNTQGIYHHGKVRFEVEQMPVDLQAWSTTLTFTVPVRESTPDLLLRAEGWLDGLATRFLGRRDAQLGDRDFDDRFLVDADGRVAERLLDEAARRAILTICDFDEPLLEVAGGLCRLQFATDGKKTAFDAALALLLHIHRARFDLPLLQQR